MAPAAGRLAQVHVGAYDISPYLKSAGLSIDSDTAETTTFGNIGKTYITTLYSATLSCDGVWETTQDGINNGLNATDDVPVTYFPMGGRTAGYPAWLMTTAQTNYSPSSSKDDAVQFGWEAMSESPIVPGISLRPLGTDSGTTNGSTYDGTAATTTGWTAILHVTAVSSGSWVVKLQDASASNFSDGADVTSASFTAATGATSQRLVSASGATLRRYIRYVATVTGGSTPTITFALSVARLTSAS